MKIYKKSALSLAIKTALLFSGISFSGISVNAIAAGSKCDTPKDDTTISDNRTATCNLANGESLIIENGGSIDVSGDTTSETVIAINIDPSIDVGGITVKQGGKLVAGGGGIYDDGGKERSGIFNAGNITKGIDNSGTISGKAGITSVGGNVSIKIINNQSMIQGGTSGLNISSNVTDGIYNSGTIYGKYSVFGNQTGVIKTIKNQANALIQGKTSDRGVGIHISNHISDSIDNSGKIIGDRGINIEKAGVVNRIINQKSGVITGMESGIQVFGEITNDIDNSGTITANQAIRTEESSKIKSIINNDDGIIKGKNFSIVNHNVIGDIKNSGTITGPMLNQGDITDNIQNSNEINGSIINVGFVNSIQNLKDFNGDISNRHMQDTEEYGSTEYIGIINKIQNSGTIAGNIENTSIIKEGIHNSGTIKGKINNTHKLDAVSNKERIGTINGGIYNSGTISGGIYNSGTINGDVALGNANLYLSGSNTTLNGAISGTKETIVTISDGMSMLTGQSTQFDGITNVAGGILALKGTLGSPNSTLTVKSGGSVSGKDLTGGTIGGATTIENGGHLTNQYGGLTFNRNLFLNPEANVDIFLGTEGESAPASFDVNGDLILAGSLNIKNAEQQTVAGEYDIFNYGGKLTYYNPMTLTGGIPGAFVLHTDIDKKITLIHASDITLNYWNGGDGIWQVGNMHDWTSKNGDIHYHWDDTDKFVIFNKNGGTVQVDNSGGNVKVHGMQFITNGYTIAGQPLTLVNDKNGSAKIRVGADINKSVNTLATIATDLTGDAVLEKMDGGTLVITSNNNSYKGGTKITGGTLQLGNNTTTGNLPGTVSIGTQGALAFNHSDNFTFGNPITGQGNLVKKGANALTLTGASSYSGVTDIQQGTLLQGKTGAFSVKSNFITRPGSMLNLGGDNTTLAGLDNGGTVLFGGDKNAVGRTLTVNGDYTGNNGVVELSTVLGGDNSATDKLVINGNATGKTLLDISNAGGKGALTHKGIEVVHVNGTSDATFGLRSDYHHEGVPVVVIGAYAYHLEKDTAFDKATASGKTEKATEKTGESWALTSAWKDKNRLQAGVSVYESYGRILQTINAPVSLSNRIAAYQGNLRDATGFAPMVGDKNAVRLPNGVWGQITGSYGKLSPRVSSSGVDNITYKMGRAQVGAERPLYENGQGSVVGGVFAQFSRIDADVDAEHGDGNIQANGYTVGGTGTWLGNNGVYLDGLAQITYFDNELESKAAGKKLGEGKGAFGYALSVEAGKQLDLTPAWSLTPQAQLTYSAINMDNFNDSFGTQVKFNQSRSAKLRVGTTLNYGQKWRDEQSKKEKAANFYGLVNVRQELLARKDSVDVAGTSFHGSNDRTWGEVGAGGSYSWNEGKYLVYSQATANTSLNSFADNYELGGKIGLRVAW
ncbi:MAG: autotransporter outer membrane beta-barrel domain-containing protein [Enterobacteriaceae bacterium]|jgi:outer membrane autotransporter protein|nr:autotransporter outer membrane beta-barrel domain-containing protein [Enterobacteriaceae bacterium]